MSERRFYLDFSGLRVYYRLGLSVFVHTVLRRAIAGAECFQFSFLQLAGTDDPKYPI